VESTQGIFNYALAIILMLIGWWNKNIWDSIKEAKASLSDHAKNHNDLKLTVVGDYVKRNDFEKNIDLIAKKLDKLESLEVLLAGNYVTQKSFESVTKDLISKLDRIEQKLDNKVDK